MRKQSFNAPKRASKRPALTRDDAQMNANDFRLRDGIPFHPVPCGVGKNLRYRLELENACDRIVGLDALEDRLFTAGLNLRVSAVENILNTLLEVLPAYIAETGRSVRIGNLVTLKPCVTGTLDHANDAADPTRNHLEIRATVGPALRYALSRAPLVNMKRSSDGISQVTGGPDGKSDELDAEHEVVVVGWRIYLPVQPFDAADGKGRAWLETLEGERIGRFAVTLSGESLLHLRLHLDAADLPRGGTARLVIETRGTFAASEDAASPVLSYRRKVKLVG